jgi:hypothetical protein
MGDLLDRTLQEPVVEQRPPAVTGPAPPKRTPPVAPTVTTPWPRNAKLLAAVLVVVALLGAMGTIIGFASGDDTSAVKRQYQTQIDQLTDQRDSALSTNAGVVSQLATANDRVTTIEQARDALNTELTAAKATVTTLTAQATDLQAKLDSTTVSNAALQGQLSAQVDKTTWAIAERDALAKTFPLTFDSSLVGVDLVGTYDITWHEVYNSIASMNGQVPSVNTMVVSTSPEGWPTIKMNGFVTAGLHRVDGALFTIVDSTTAVPPVGTTPRLARVAITLYAHGVSVGNDGRRHVDDLGASVAISAPAVAGEPDGVAIYGAELTPRK